MSNYHPRADKRRREAIDSVVDRMDSTHLGDVVRDQLYYGDNPILGLADAMESAYGLAEDDKRVRSSDAERAAFSAGEQLRDALRLEAEAQVFAVVERVAEDKIALEGYPDEPGASAMDEAVEIVENGALPPREDHDD